MNIKLLFLVALFSSILMGNQNSFILNTSGLVDVRAIEKIETIGLEVQSKLGVNIYLDIKGDNGIDIELPLKERISIMKSKEQELISSLKKPFVILTMALDQKYSNILMSDELKKVIDRDDILDGYVIPLLAAKDKNTLNSKVSAASLNGYAQIADSIAEFKQVKLESSIGSEGKVASSIWKVFMYTIVLSGIILYFIIILKEKKIKANHE